MNRFAKNVKKVEFRKDPKSCGECYYFWFKGLKRWCFHPDRNCPIKDFESGCGRFSDLLAVDQQRRERAINE